MKRRLAVAAECDYIEGFTPLFHFAQASLKVMAQTLYGRESCRAGALRVIACLAIDAVERAYLPVVGEKIYPERCSEPSAVDRAEYGGMKQYCLIFSHIAYQDLCVNNALRAYMATSRSTIAAEAGTEMK